MHWLFMKTYRQTRILPEKAVSLLGTPPEPCSKGRHPQVVDLLVVLSEEGVDITGRRLVQEVRLEVALDHDLGTGQSSADLDKISYSLQSAMRAIL